jgi:hypothetical protein
MMNLNKTFLAFSWSVKGFMVAVDDECYLIG